MKNHPIHPRILLICALLLVALGALRAAPPLPRVPAPAPGSRIDQEPGFFSRLFERLDRANQDDDDDDDEDEDDDDDDDEENQRFRPRGWQPPFPPPAPGTTIITTTRTTNQVPVLSVYPRANRYPRVPEVPRSIAPPALRPLTIPREIQPSPPPPVRLEQRYPPVREQIRTAIVPAPTVVVPVHTVIVPSRIVIVPSTVAATPASRQFPVAPPRSTILAPLEDVRIATPSSQQPFQAAPSSPRLTSIPVDPASLSAPVLPPVQPTPPPSLSSFANRIPVPAPPSQGPPSANPPVAEPPAPPPEPSFGTPVPGRRGLVYPPGQEALPENMIDVTGITSGTKVRDPVSRVVFRVP